MSDLREDAQERDLERHQNARAVLLSRYSGRGCSSSEAAAGTSSIRRLATHLQIALHDVTRPQATSREACYTTYCCSSLIGYFLKVGNILIL